MIFKKLNMEYAAFDLENLPDLKQMLVENCELKRETGPLADLAQGPLSVPSSLGSSAPVKKRRNKGGNRRDQGAVVRDAITALALCHNVTPTYPDPENRKHVEYQASSPDEIALVKFAESLEMRLVERD
jgi:phospholipid-translocating ATPase